MLHIRYTFVIQYIGVSIEQSDHVKSCEILNAKFRTSSEYITPDITESITRPVTTQIQTPFIVCPINIVRTNHNMSILHLHTIIPLLVRHLIGHLQRLGHLIHTRMPLENLLRNTLFASVAMRVSITTTDVAATARIAMKRSFGILVEYHTLETNIGGK